MVTVACVQVGNYMGRGAEYVNKLRAAVARNLHAPHVFACLTDDSIGFDPLVEVIPAHAGLSGWWQKIALFKPRTFKTERVLFFDLDTWITGDITALATRAWEFAMLRHLVVPTLPASGAMAWRCGSAGARAIWAAYLKLGREPDHFRGDQGFMDVSLKAAGVKPELLQESFGGIYSWRLHCRGGVPKDARVVCFHVRPKPHEVPQWASM